MLFQLILPGTGRDVEIDYPTEVLKEPRFKFETLADVISEALKYVFPAAGLILFFMLITGGFQLLTSAGDPERTKKGYGKIIWAIIGFLVIFIAYWLIQILEAILGIKVF